MKIDRIILSLQSIKKENEENITKNKIEIDKLEKTLKQLEDEISNLDSIQNKYVKIKSIKGSMLKIIKILLIPFQVPVIIGLLVLMVYLSESFYVCLVLASICSTLTINIIYTYFMDVLPISDGYNGIFRNYLFFFRQLVKKKTLIDDKINELLEIKESYNKQVNETERKRDALLSECSEMSEENYYIEGNEMGINILANKYQMEEISDNLEIVDFVGKRLERKNK